MVETFFQIKSQTVQKQKIKSVTLFCNINTYFQGSVRFYITTVWKGMSKSIILLTKSH